MSSVLLLKIEYFRNGGFNWVLYIDDYQKSFKAYKIIVSLMQERDTLTILGFTEAELQEGTQKKYLENSQNVRAI